MKYFQDGGNVPYKKGTIINDQADISFWDIFRASQEERNWFDRDNLNVVNKKYGSWWDLMKDKWAAKRYDRFVRRNGDPRVSNLDENTRNIHNAIISTNTPYITLTTPQNTPTQQTTPKKSYRYSFENNDMAKAYQELVNSLYTNGNYDILDKYLTDGKITGSGITSALGDTKFKDYVTSLLNKGLNQDQINKILKLAPEWKPPVYKATTPFTPTANQIKSYQRANNLKVDGKIGEQTRPLWNRDKITADSFGQGDLSDYYIVTGGDGTKYYIDPEGRYYTEGKGDTPGTISFKDGKLTFNKKGGKMIYFQNGGIVQQDNQKQILKAAFTAAAKGDIQTLAKVLGITNEEQFKKFIELTNEMSQQKEDPEMAEMATLALQGLSKVTKAEKGTKLEYIKMLQGKCPEGYEMTYFKLGGKVCKKCQKIEEACKGKKMKCGGESPIVSEFKNKKKK